jgi:hypothetical protein
MTNPTGRYRPADLPDRIVIAAGGGVLLFVLALVAFSRSWIAGLLVLALVPVHVLLAITDTAVFEDPKTVPKRALAELGRLTGSGAAGAGFASAGGYAGYPAQPPGGPVPWGQGPPPGGQGPAPWGQDPRQWGTAQSGAAPWAHPSGTPGPASPTPYAPGSGWPPPSAQADASGSPDPAVSPDDAPSHGGFLPPERAADIARSESEPPESRAEAAAGDQFDDAGDDQPYDADDDPDATIQRPPRPTNSKGT